MKICVGSTNQVKIEAVREALSEYGLDAEIISVKAPSDVSEQPKSLDETIKGAMNRAKNAFSNCTYSIGLESGLVPIPHTKTGYMDICACAIYDGKEFHLGMSSAFEYPREMTRLVFEENLDLDQAAFKTGLTKNPDVGSEEGVIGILTKGRLLRKDYTKQAVVTALIHLENPHLF